MLQLIHRFGEGLRKLFPSTFTIAISLTLLTFLLALMLTDNPAPPENHFLELLGFWYLGLWNTGMLAFAVQMMLILVLGYVLASTSVFQKIIGNLLVFCTSTAKAALLVTLLTVLVSLFNWGLGLIFGAIFARKVGEYASLHRIRLNYPLIAAAGYSGLMVWHGGISGSAPLKVAEQGHFFSLVGKDLPAISMGQTVFSFMNISIAIALLVTLPVMLYILGRMDAGSSPPDLPETGSSQPEFTPSFSGAERIDQSKITGIGLGMVFLFIALWKTFQTGSISVLDPDFLNVVLLGLSLVFCGTIARFLSRVQDAMGAASGILIQFPLYFGIMGIMKYSGLVEVLSNSMMAVSTVSTFPLFTFFSAAVVNVFIPSGGGQWVVQGPIIVEAAQNLGVPLSKSVMALAYGDQVTNMIQPFWALPLLGITGLKPKDIIPYTLLLMVIGGVIFVSGLLLF